MQNPSLANPLLGDTPRGIREFLSERLRLARVELATWRFVLFLSAALSVALFLAWLDISAGLLLSLIWILAAATLASWLISVFRPVRVDIHELDAELDAGELLLTWSTLRDTQGVATGRVAELVERDLALLIFERQGVSSEQNERRVRRISWRLLIVLLLLLAAWCLLPGNRAGQGRGFLPGVGKGLAPADGSSPSGNAGESEQAAQRDDLDEADDVDRKDAEAGKKAEKKKTADSDKLPDKDPGRDSAGDAAQRLAKKQREQSSGSLEPEFSKKPKRSPEMPMEEWKRQEERALARGVLASWEGKWIKDYGRALDALDKRNREKKRSAGKCP